MATDDDSFFDLINAHVEHEGFDRRRSLDQRSPLPVADAGNPNVDLDLEKAKIVGVELGKDLNVASRQKAERRRRSSLSAVGIVAGRSKHEMPPLEPSELRVRVQRFTLTSSWGVRVGPQANGIAIIKEVAMYSPAMQSAIVAGDKLLQVNDQPINAQEVDTRALITNSTSRDLFMTILPDTASMPPSGDIYSDRQADHVQLQLTRKSRKKVWGIMPVGHSSGKFFTCVVMPKSTAYDCGLRSGDKLVLVDGNPPGTTRESVVRNLIACGTSCTLIVVRRATWLTGSAQ